MTWAFNQKCPGPLAKLVLIKLADCANDDGECWPSQTRVANDCELPRETVNRQIKLLAAAGILRVENRTNGTGKQANRYFLLCDATSQPDVIPRHTPCDPTSHRTVIEPSKEEPPLSPPRGEREEEFAIFWRRYPHKVEKPAAVAKFGKARAKASLAEIMAGLDRYIASKPPDRAWKNPASWLHNERWADEPAEAVRKPDIAPFSSPGFA